MTDETRKIEPRGELTLRTLAMPGDTNAAGDIFGGWLMSQADLAGSLPAHHAANGRVATVAVNSFQFIRPVLVGDLVSCYAWVTRIGNSAIQMAAAPGQRQSADYKVEVTLLETDSKIRPGLSATARITERMSNGFLRPGFFSALKTSPTSVKPVPLTHRCV